MNKSKFARVRALRVIEAKLRSQLDADRWAAFERYGQACTRVNPQGTLRHCMERFARIHDSS